MISSLSGILGFASQCGYAAGGSYQDALARYRVAQGLPAVSIDLGGVKGIGVVEEREGLRERLEKVGFRSLTENQVLRGLESAIMLPHEPQVIVGVNSGPGRHWDHHGESQLGRDARFTALRYWKSQQKSTGNSTQPNESLASRLKDVSSPGDAKRLISDAIKEKLASILSLQIEEIDLSKHPGNYGVDSLVAVDLRRMLVQQTGVELSIFDVLQSDSLESLASHVVERSNP